LPLLRQQRIEGGEETRLTTHASLLWTDSKPTNQNARRHWIREKKPKTSLKQNPI
jgi:hypothetical protein